MFELNAKIAHKSGYQITIYRCGWFDLTHTARNHHAWGRILCPLSVSIRNNLRSCSFGKMEFSYRFASNCVYFVPLPHCIRCHRTYRPYPNRSPCWSATAMTWRTPQSLVSTRIRKCWFWNGIQRNRHEWQFCQRFQSQSPPNERRIGWKSTQPDSNDFLSTARHLNAVTLRSLLLLCHIENHHVKMTLIFQTIPGQRSKWQLHGRRTDLYVPLMGIISGNDY